jgi:hypothetical protein
MSAEHARKFQDTLKRFCDTLKKRKLDHKLNIELKNPNEYKLQDVIDIATRLQSNRDASGNTNICMRYIRTFFRETAKHKSTLTVMLKFVPNDTYGAIFVGGFALILAVRYTVLVNDQAAPLG